MNRYDDPLGIYHTVYAASTRYGALIETLAPLRPKPKIRLAEAEPGMRATPAAGTITNWLERRHIGEARISGVFVDIAASESIAYLRHKLADRFAALGTIEFDLSALTSARRELTMEISRFIFELEFREQRRFDGICYPSRLGHNIMCWAIFEDDGHACLEDRASQPIDPADKEIEQALRDSRITLG